MTRKEKHLLREVGDAVDRLSEAHDLILCRFRALYVAGEKKPQNRSDEQEMDPHGEFFNPEKGEHPF